MYTIMKNYKKPEVEIANVNTPEIRDDEVLIEVEAASICGTDVNI
jgi:threonine 3-dehydrogenase